MNEKINYTDGFYKIFRNIPKDCYIPNYIVKKLEKFVKIQIKKKSVKIRKRKIDEVIGFDTETIDGYCKLICAYPNRYAFTNSIDDILSFLTKRKYQNTLNVFWNIDYDFFSIIKYLPKILVEGLYYKKEIHYNEYKIKWIPKKAFIINKNKRNYYFFDLWQFYRMSLDNAGKKYLNIGKIDDIDREHIHKYFTNPKLKSKLIDYCLRDCYITTKLGELMKEKFEKLNLDFTKPFSPGSISLQYFSNEISHIRFKRTFWNLYAYLSYFGGRFEILRRGYIPKCYVFDINSAYPYQISKLPDITAGFWEYSYDYDPNADIGFYKVVITVEDDILTPICFKNKELVVYPNTNKVLSFITKDELELIEKHYPNSNIDIIDSWQFYITEPIYPFRKIKNIYDERRKIKKSDKVLQLNYKLIMNSLYGKTAELIEKYTKTKSDNFDKEVFDGNDIIYLEKIIENGKFFNPVYASLITAKTRVMLLDKALENPKHVIALFTDSIVTTKKYIECSNELGGWDLEIKGEGLFLLSGIYEIRNYNESEEIRKTRFRGFKIDPSFSFFDYIEKNPHIDNLIYAWKKAVKLGEVITHHKKHTLDDLNLFIMMEKSLHIDSERKRNWLYNPKTFGELLHQHIDSIPLYLP